MLTHIRAAKCVGIDATEVTVEIDIDRGIGIHLVGLADVAVKESLLRTTTALESLGFRIPGKKIVINLAPADLRKNGSGYDLPIAIGIIVASEQLNLPDAGNYLIMGELGLNGSVRSIPGALPFTELAMKAGYKGIILPWESAAEAVELIGTKVYGVRTLLDVTRILSDSESCEDLLIQNSSGLPLGDDKARAECHALIDLSEIIGQSAAKRCIEIGAAGGHNILMIGAPGSGKSSLAKALAGILPQMTHEESLITSKIYSIMGKGSSHYGLIRERPFRSPHYSASLPAIIGGGAGDNIVPGEISLAESGVLFLDEIGQMPKSVIEALRGPLEDRRVVISRLKAKVEFPANFMLVAASNPCPCGYYGEGERCTCTLSQRQAYLSKLSGPIIDRIDLQVWLHSVPAEMISSARGQTPESSAEVAQRVTLARSVQQERFLGEGISTNAQMSNSQIRRFCPLDNECQQTLENIIQKAGLSLRAYFRIIRVARTIADLAGIKDIKASHIVEAAGFRLLDRSGVR